MVLNWYWGHTLTKVTGKIKLLHEVDNSVVISVVDNYIFVYFFMSQMWAMKLTESTKIYYISDGVTYIIKVNIKEIFMGNNGYLRIFIW